MFGNNNLEKRISSLEEQQKVLAASINKLTLELKGLLNLLNSALARDATSVISLTAQLKAASDKLAVITQQEGKTKT